jgi:AcrR family transcriptional regulator
LGYGLATTGDIAKEAGVTRGAMYFHFQSKEDLARAVIAKEQSLALSASKHIHAMNRSALDTMILLCADLAQRLLADPVVRAGVRLTTEVTHFDPPLRSPYDEWIRTFSHLAAQAIADGDFGSDVNPEKFARFLIPTFTGIQLVSDTYTGREDLLQRVREMWEYILPSVVPTDTLEIARRRLDEIIPDLTKE